MRKLVLFVVIALVAAPLAAWLADNPGQVRIAWLDVEIETTVGLLLVGVLLVAAAAVLLVELLRWLFGLPRRLRDRRTHKRLAEGYAALTTGLVAAAAGDVASARHHVRRAEKLLDDGVPALLLLEAQTAQLQGDETDAIRRFRAMLRDPETELLGLRGLLAHALKDGDHATALELARKAHRRSPGTPWVVSTLFDLLTRAEEWEEALVLLNQLADLKLITPEQARRRRAILHLMLARKALAAERFDEALRQARRAVKLAPAFPPAAVEASRIAARIGRNRLARRIVENAWRLEPHPDLLAAYLELGGKDNPAERLRRVERLRSLQPFDPLSYIALAEAQMAGEDYEAARHSLARARELGATARVYRLLAELERRSGAPEEKVQEWLARAFDAPADKAWVCEDTGEVLPEWKPFGVSGRFDAVQWETPAKLAALEGGRAPTTFLTHTETPVPATTPAPAPEGSAETARLPARERPAPEEAETAEAKASGAGEADAEREAGEGESGDGKPRTPADAA